MVDAQLFPALLIRARPPRLASAKANAERNALYSSFPAIAWPMAGVRPRAAAFGLRHRSPSRSNCAGRSGFAPTLGRPEPAPVKTIIHSLLVETNPHASEAMSNSTRKSPLLRCSSGRGCLNSEVDRLRNLCVRRGEESFRIRSSCVRRGAPRRCRGRSGRAPRRQARVRAWIAHCHASRRGPSRTEFDCRPRPASIGRDLHKPEGGRQIAEPDALAPPPRVRCCAEELQLRSVLEDQHLSDRVRELGTDPGVRHIADIVRYAGVPPDDLGPPRQPAGLRPPSTVLRSAKASAYRPSATKALRSRMM